MEGFRSPWLGNLFIERWRLNDWPRSYFSNGYMEWVCIRCNDLVTDRYQHLLQAHHDMLFMADPLAIILQTVDCLWGDQESVP